MNKVESGRIELPSKQATKTLSTCLVFVSFSTLRKTKNHQLNA